MSTAPNRKRGLHDVDNSDIEMIMVPKELVEPLKKLIDKMCRNLENQNARLDIGTLHNIGGTPEDVAQQKTVAINEFNGFKDKLHKNLKNFNREEVVADLPKAEFEQFKTVRKNLTQWSRLGNACCKRDFASADNAHRIIHCKISTAPSIMSSELRMKITDHFETVRSTIEEDLQLKLLDELLVKTSELGEEFEACTDNRTRLIWAKAFRATLANGDYSGNKHSTPNNSKNVSFKTADTNSSEASTSSKHLKGKSILKKSNRKFVPAEESPIDSDSSSSEYSDPRPARHRHHKNRSFRGRKRY